MFKKHGHRSNYKMSPTYQSWRHMKQRCNNPNNVKYNNYGGRGIKVCSSWNDFENFLKDMGERPINKSIDRIDNDQGYFKENCKWSTINEQNKNRRIVK